MTWTKGVRWIRSAAAMLILGVLLGGVWLSSSCAPAGAQSYDGIDIVFLVDQSGSMGGPAYGFPDREATDPLDLRFEAVIYALNTLAAYRQTIAPNVTIRMAVVAFGDTTLPIMGWTTIVDPTSPVSWDVQRAELEAQLSADTFRQLTAPGDANLGNTNFIAAFEAAEALFAASPMPNHLRVIITLTDGEPCVVDGPYQFPCGNEFYEREYMDQLLTVRSEAFPADGYEVYTLVLDASGDLWQNWQSTWETIVYDPDHAVRLENSQQIGFRFQNILCDLMVQTGVSGQNVCNSNPLPPGSNAIDVPPYQLAMRISIFKSTLSPGVLEVRLPDGTQLAENDPRLTVSDPSAPIEIWEITSPPPGTWSFTVGSVDDQVILLELVPATAQIELPDTTIKLFESFTCTVKLLDETGSPLPNYPPPYDALDASITVHLPDNTVQTVPLEPVQDGIYEATLQATQSGTHTVGLTAVSRDLSGAEVVLYDNSAASQFEVSPIIMIAPDPVQPDYLVGEQLALTTSFAQNDSTPAAVPGGMVVAILQSTDGTTSVEQALEQDASGQYHTTFDLLTPGTFTVTLTGSATLGDGRSIAIDEYRSTSFEVLPSRLVSLVITAPEQGASSVATTGFSFEVTELELVFEARTNDTNELVDLYALALRPNDLLQVRVENSEEEVFSPQAVIRPGEQPGQYIVTLDDLTPGSYTATVSMAGQLQNRFVVDPQRAVATVSFDRGYDWFTIGVLGAAGAAGLSLLVLLGVVIARRRTRRKHPARGNLHIVRNRNFGADIDTLARIPLDSYRSNQVVLGPKQLPRDTGLTKLVIECTDATMSQKKRVLVTGYAKKEVVIKRQQIGPGGSITLRPQTADYGEEDVTYQILKDPDHLDYGISGSSLF